MVKLQQAVALALCNSAQSKPFHPLELEEQDNLNQEENWIFGASKVVLRCFAIPNIDFAKMGLQKCYT